MRGPRPTRKQPVAIVLGGSAAFGWRISSERETLSGALAQLNPAVEVLNGGVVGYSSGQELGLMVHYLDRFKPSLYISFTGWNDLYDSWVQTGRPLGYLGFNSSFFAMEEKLAKLGVERERERENSSHLLHSNHMTTMSSFLQISLPHLLKTSGALRA